MDELPSHSQPVNPSHVTINGLSYYCTHNASVNNSIYGHAQTSVNHLDHTLQRAHNSTWTTHTAETTTLLEATRLQKPYTYMCNIVTELVTEFYLYSIVYIYLINSRLDVTHSVHHHFRTIQTLSWCQRVVGFSRNWENLTAIEFTTTTTMTNRSDTLSWCQISGKNSRNRRENLTVIKLTHTMTTTMTVNSRKNLHTHTAFQEAF